MWVYPWVGTVYHISFALSDHRHFSSWLADPSGPRSDSALIRASPPTDCQCPRFYITKCPLKWSHSSPSFISLRHFSFQRSPIGRTSHRNAFASLPRQFHQKLFLTWRSTHIRMMLSPLDSLITLRSGDNASVAADKTTKMGRVHAITEEHEIMRLFFLCGVRTYYGVLFYRFDAALLVRIISCQARH